MLLIVSTLTVPAQEYRAQVSGVVTDPSGAVLPGAQVTITSLEKNVDYKSVTNNEGAYVVPFLTPGKYSVAIELTGFKRFMRSEVELKVNDKLRIDAALEIGGISETVTVSGQTATVETDTASRGTVIDRKEIASLPTSGRNPFQLAWLTPGVQKSGSWRMLRPMDTAGSGGMSINGGRSQENEILIDGMTAIKPNRGVSLVPTMDATQEFKVQTNSYDAQYGRNGGGVVNVSLKSGTNKYHGNLFWDEQQKIFNANTAELNRATNNIDENGKARRQPGRIHMFGAEIDGPVIKDKLFVMLSYEAIRQFTGDPATYTIPQADIRGGNFQGLRNSSNQPVIIYDPMTTRLAADGKSYIRDPFANNIVPANRINPIAAKAATYLPQPNSLGTGPAQLSNLIQPSQWIIHWDSYIGRLDYALNQNNNFFIRYGHNLLHEGRGYRYFNVADPTGNAPLVRGDTSGAADWTSTINPTTIFNLRVGMLKWHVRNGSLGYGFNPATLGFASSLTSQMVGPSHFPLFQMEGYEPLGNGGQNLTPDYTYSSQGNLTKLWGRHTFKMGTEFRIFRSNVAQAGYTSGQYSFSIIDTGANPQLADKVSGSSYASFLLGYPSGGVIQKNAYTANQGLYYVLFFQDDWKVSRRLTLNLGMRWDYETPWTERFNRITRGFAFGQPAPISATGLTLTGGLLYAGTEGASREAFNRDRNNFQPRFGLAYMMNEKTSIRGGYGLYYLGQSATGSNLGFSQDTPIIQRTQVGIPVATLTNPFPSKLLDPIGNSQGTATNLGLSLGVNYLDRDLPYAHVFSVDVERQLPWNVVANVGFIGNRTRHLPVSLNLNAIPTSELGKVSTYYTESVPNPMAGKLPNNAALNGATIQRFRLMYKYPQYAGLTLSNVPIGKNDYAGFQSKIAKRFSEGFSLIASYTIAKTLEEMNTLNDQDVDHTDFLKTKLERRIARELDSPQRYTLATVWSLPFGKGKMVGSDVPTWANHIIGDWQWNLMVEYFSGYALDHPGGPKTIDGTAKLPADERTLERWYNGSVFKAQAPYTLRDYPTMFPDVRNPDRFDVSVNIMKNFMLTERLKLQYRLDIINALNHPWFMNNYTTSPTASGLGGLNQTQANLARTLHMQLRLEF